jgi:hypothetical protein
MLLEWADRLCQLSQWTARVGSLPNVRMRPTAVGRFSWIVVRDLPANQGNALVRPGNANAQELLS